MSLLLFISLIAAFILGLFGRPLYLVARRVLLRQRGPVVVPPGESGIEKYQSYKEGLGLKPIQPPLEISTEAAARFSKLSPLVQRQVMAARKREGLDA